MDAPNDDLFAAMVDREVSLIDSKWLWIFPNEHLDQSWNDQQKEEYLGGPMNE